MTKIKATFLSDPGHGWLGVTRHDYNIVGAPVTEYSYYSKDMVFLEEDCDATAFMDTAKRKGIEVDIKYLKPSTGDSPIRSMKRMVSTAPAFWVA